MAELIFYFFNFLHTLHQVRGILVTIQNDWYGLHGPKILALKVTNKVTDLSLVIELYLRV
jgi:hypothetical protein